MKPSDRILFFWHRRSLRSQLVLGIVAVGLLATILSTTLLGLFLRNYVEDRQGTQLAQQAQMLGQACAGSDQEASAFPQNVAHCLREALTSIPDRRAILIDAQGHLLFVTSMPASLLQPLLARVRHDLTTTAIAAEAPGWVVMEGQVITEVHLPASSESLHSQPRVAEALLLEEDQEASTIQWRRLLILLMFSAGTAVVLIALGGLFAGKVLARPLHEMTITARQIANGNYRARVTPGGPSEVHELGHALNGMVNAILHQQQVERDLLANVSHELANPLSLIHGYAEGLVDGVITDEAQRLAALRAISVETSRLARLSGDLLDLALLETGQITVYNEPILVNELLEGLHQRFLPLAQRMQVRLILERPSTAPVICTDGLRLEQVLVNLLNNALRHTPDGGAITLGAETTDEALHLKVADTGEGIAPDELARVWERFYRSDSSRDRRTGTAGAGLGLAICRSIVTLLGGTIRIESSLGCGTIVTIELPHIKQRSGK